MSLLTNETNKLKQVLSILTNCYENDNDRVLRYSKEITVLLREPVAYILYRNKRKIFITADDSWRVEPDIETKEELAETLKEWFSNTEVLKMPEFTMNSYCWCQSTNTPPLDNQHKEKTESFEISKYTYQQIKNISAYFWCQIT